VNLLPLVLLLVIPILAYRWANKKKPAAKLTVLGISWGLVASPFSMGLYTAYFIPYVGLVPGMIGLVSTMLHGAPGYEISVALGFIESHTVVENGGSIICYLIDGVFWAVVYGLLGFLGDRFRLSKHQAGAKV
jgi:hypothetical protein